MTQDSEGSEYDRLFYPFLFEGGKASLEDVLAQVRHSTIEKCRPRRTTQTLGPSLGIGASYIRKRKKSACRGVRRLRGCRLSGGRRCLYRSAGVLRGAPAVTWQLVVGSIGTTG